MAVAFSQSGHPLHNCQAWFIGDDVFTTDAAQTVNENCFVEVLIVHAINITPEFKAMSENPCGFW